MRPVVVIFGAAVRADGQPSGALRARIAAALACGATLADPVYLPTGGQGRFGPAEADVMAEALEAAGVARGSIVRERTGTNTVRSALASAPLIGRAPAYVATSGYHMARCVVLLRLAGVRARPGRAAAGPASRAWRRRWLWRLREVPAIPLDCVALLAMRWRARRLM